MKLNVVPFLPIAVLSVAVVLHAATIAPEPPQAGARIQALTMRGYPKVGEPPVITLREPGAEPRKALRYVVPANFKARMEVTVSGVLKVSTGGAAAPAHMPAMKLTADVGVTGVAANGDISYDLTFVNLAVEAGSMMTDEELQSFREHMPGAAWSIKGRGTMSARGINTSSGLEVRDPELREALFSLTSSLEKQFTPFPEEAVGVGARWEVRQATTSGWPGLHPIIFEQTEYEVLSIEGSTAVLRVRTERTGPSQVVRNVRLEPEMDMERLEGSGLGFVAVQLDSLVPSLDVTSTTETLGKMVNAGGKPSSVTFSDRLRVRFTAPGAAAAEDRALDVKALRGITVVNLGGTHTSAVGPDWRCYPRAVDDKRGDFAGVSIAMGGLLAAATWELEAGGLTASGRSTDFLHIDAQIRDAAPCTATITLELRRGLGKVHETRLPNGNISKGYGQSPVVWRRTFEITGAPAGFSSRVIDRFKLVVAEFADGVARAGK